MSAGEEGLSYQQVLQRIGELAEDLTEHPDPKVADKATELLDWVDAFHRDGLGRLVEMIRSWRGEIFLESVGTDDIVGTMLAVYGLGQDRETIATANAEVEEALKSVRPIVESHGGDLEVVSVIDGVVSVRMKGTCDGCPSSSATLTYGVEQALRDNWMHFRRLELVDAAEEIDPEKADLECVTAPAGASGAPARAASSHSHAPSAVPTPQGSLLQIRGHEVQ